MSYRQFRADFAKAAWLQHMGDWDHEEAAQSAVARADALIAELERTEACPACEQNGSQCLGCGLVEHGTPAGCVEPKPAPPAPELPLLGTGWKWAEINKHQIGKYDVWVRRDKTLVGCIGDVVGMTLRIDFPLATPDWHNPENIESPGEGWRFHVKSENRNVGDMFHYSGKWRDCMMELRKDDDATYRTPATRPLPPVLADEKEAQP